MAELGSVGWNDRADRADRGSNRGRRLVHGHPIVLLLVGATLLVGLVVVITAGVLHGHDVAQFVGAGFTSAAATLWFAAAVLLGPAEQAPPELERSHPHHAG